MTSISKYLALRTAYLGCSNTFYERHYASAAYAAKKIMCKLANDRRPGSITAALLNEHRYLYQTSKSRPGFIEQVESATGKVTVGSFYDGDFHTEYK